MNYLFDAIDREGERVQGTIQGIHEDEVKRQLEQEFGYRVSRVYPKESSSPPESSKEEPIIFQSAPGIIHSTPVLDEEELNQAHQSIQLLVSEKGAAISQQTRDKLLYLDGMIDLARELQNKSRWKFLKNDIRHAQKLAERDIQHYEEAKWRAYEEKNPTPKVNRFADISEKISSVIPNIPRIPRNENVGKIITWLRVINLPDEQNEQEVLLKEKYESIWNELQRFAGALLIFYVIFFFVTYYLKRSGAESLLVRIYDTTLFKELMLGIFLLYSALTVRKEWFGKRLMSDAALVLSIVVLMVIFLR